MIGRLESLQFDLYDKSVFYAVGSTNEAFEQVDGSKSARYEEMKVAGLAKSSDRKLSQFRIEKFFID